MMGNLLAHELHGIRQAIEAAGASLRYLPPYSPDFNPIEMAFAKLCLVPDFAGAFLSSDSKDALWDRFYTGAPQRQRRSVERYNIVKRA
jgi:transposase